MPYYFLRLGDSEKKYMRLREEDRKGIAMALTDAMVDPYVYAESYGLIDDGITRSVAHGLVIAVILVNRETGLIQVLDFYGGELAD